MDFLKVYKDCTDCANIAQNLNVQLVQIHTCCSHDASASLTQGVTPLFHLGLAPTSPLHYLSLKIFVTFGLLPPSLGVTFEFSHFWTPALSIVLLFSYQSLMSSLFLKSPKSQNHCCLLLTFSFPPIIVTGPLNLFWLWSQCDLKLASLIWPFLWGSHISISFTIPWHLLRTILASAALSFSSLVHIFPHSDHFPLILPMMESKIQAVAKISPSYALEKFSWSLSDDERKIALHFRP